MYDGYTFNPEILENLSKITVYGVSEVRKLCKKAFEIGLIARTNDIRQKTSKAKIIDTEILAILAHGCRMSMENVQDLKTDDFHYDAELPHVIFNGKYITVKVDQADAEHILAHKEFCEFNGREYLFRKN